MPFQVVNGARLYYETLGEAAPHRSPLLLIHGAASTGQADWSPIAPRLAEAGHFVIVPDCRGHGQSANPAHTYSFSELAADCAGLVRALGFARAHYIGHSNGGNVALVALLEQSEAVHTCVLQAANAFVSADLKEKEPYVFDADRVARQAPQWRDEMVALHSPTHGHDYWRELLRLTVHAIITEPNYAPADLAQAARPVLVIQGENDTVNAPSRHAQFIAEHVPHAELWLPAEAGHNVHLDRTDEWMACVTDFLARRG